MLLYRKKVFITHNTNADIGIDTDNHDKYHSLTVDKINRWWEMNAQTELRDWQKDIILKMGADAMGDWRSYILYKKGQGHNQTHDMCLTYFSHSNLFIFSTQRDFWIIEKQKGKLTMLDVNDSVGSILDPIVRQTVIYPIFDELKTKYNPSNQCLFR